jgi:hypothetical protein
MDMKSATALLIALAAVASHANASSEDAWKALDKAVVDSCIKASQLKNVKPSGKAGFDDSVGYEALMLQGRYPQPHMKNLPGNELCLYNRHSKKATVTEWNILNTTPKK